MRDWRSHGKNATRYADRRGARRGNLLIELRTTVRLPSIESPADGVGHLVPGRVAHFAGRAILICMSLIQCVMISISRIGKYVT